MESIIKIWKKVGHKVMTFYFVFILGRSPIFSLAIFTIAINLWWGFILMTAKNLFSVQPTFHVLASLAPEVAYSAVCFILAFGLCFCFIRKFHSVAQLFAILNMVLWFFISYALVFGNPVNTGTGVYILIALANGALYLRIKEEK